MNKENMKTIDLILTESCNLNCMYCYEKYKNPKSMSSDKAIEIIDKELNMDDEFEYVSIHLFGGEPFLVFPTIKKIIEHMEKQNYKKKYQLFTTTNGTLVHGKIQDWLKEKNKILICGLSLDGNREVHNLNRSNSFDQIDLKFFKENYPNQSIKMTISTNTLPYLAESVIFCHKQGFLVSCNLAFNIDWSNKENCEYLERELLKLINFYIENPDIKPCSLLDSKIERILAFQNKSYNPKWCGAGTNTKAYTSDGKFYPCQFFTPLSVGDKKIDANFSKKIDKSMLDKKCINCKIASICPTCYGANFARTGNLYKKDDDYCKLTKIIIYAVSYFKGMLWKLGRLNLTEKQEKNLLKSIEIIQNEFNKEGGEINV